MSEDISADISTELRERALLIVPLGRKAKMRQDEAHALCRHSPPQMLAAELTEKALPFLSSCDLCQRFFLLREDRGVCEYEPFACCCPPRLCSVRKHVKLAATQPPGTLQGIGSMQAASCRRGRRRRSRLRVIAIGWVRAVGQEVPKVPDAAAVQRVSANPGSEQQRLQQGVLLGVSFHGRTLETINGGHVNV